MKKILSWIAVIFWMALIFYSSSQVADESNGVSLGVTELIMNVAEKIAPGADFNIEDFNHIVRKNGHFFAYLILGVFALNALRRSGVVGRKSIGLALLICVLYASSDEFHQTFVPGRGPQVKDVLIDSAGAITGLLVYSLVAKKMKRQKNPHGI